MTYVLRKNDIEEYDVSWTYLNTNIFNWKANRMVPAPIKFMFYMFQSDFILFVYYNLFLLIFILGTIYLLVNAACLCLLYKKLYDTTIIEQTSFSLAVSYCGCLIG